MTNEQLKESAALKLYSVSIKAFATLVVEATSEEDAMENALNGIRLGDLQHDETYVEMELTEPEDIERHKRHADMILKADGTEEAK